MHGQKQGQLFNENNKQNYKDYQMSRNIQSKFISKVYLFVDL